MSILIDTNILVRLANRSDALYAVADGAVAELFLRNETLLLAPQSLIEFRNVATRAKALNGLGMAIIEAETKGAEFEALFSLLPETQDIFPTWKAVVGALGVIGKQVHDARLVAVCHVHKVTHLLTFNIGQFTTLSSYGPGLVIVDPATL